MSPLLKLPRSATSPRLWMVSKLLLAAGTIAVADWLFFAEWPGLSFALFFGLIAGIVVFANPVRATRSMRPIAWALWAASLLPLVEDPSTLSFLFGLLGTTGFAIFMTSGRDIGPIAQMSRALFLPFFGVPRLIRDGSRVARLSKRKRGASLKWASLLLWVVPIVLFAVFLTLLSSANPLIEDAIRGIDLRPLLDLINPWRFAFWVLILCLTWPVIHLRSKRRRPAATRPVPSSNWAIEPEFGIFFGEKSILRSLMLFNALFAVQTCLDAAYLWGGFKLPHGMSYATYAHRGAYPLIATALLAAAFVLIATRRGGPAEKSLLIRRLVLIWTGQNITLVISSILRLKLYVAAFSFTDLRAVAFIWMLLLLVGLILIIVQITRRKSSRWLMVSNGISLIVVLYGSCFVNFPYLEASYNVAHCLEVSGTGPALDTLYFVTFGPAALPAFDEVPPTSPAWQAIAKYEAHMAAAELDRRVEWRSWSFRAWRLRRYLTNYSRTVSEFRKGNIPPLQP